MQVEDFNIISSEKTKWDDRGIFTKVSDKLLQIEGDPFAVRIYVKQIASEDESTFCRCLMLLSTQNSVLNGVDLKLRSDFLSRDLYVDSGLC